MLCVYVFVCCVYVYQGLQYHAFQTQQRDQVDGRLFLDDLESEGGDGSCR